ncbi:extracellular solute-binding protein [Amphibacillus cookii]|uniref:extracellular solute-binding protein n=1 Tax=Amphibacillus cookii TaxID=767787 RepID=UPI00195A6845|nr:extracellular solute-binding protein [Amphibacillus cookii]MBM7542619.1 putative aldouronate transport system substrate-binding protein [Amphibacillus cookii]
MKVKKLSLLFMLMVALMWFFVACGDADEETVTDNGDGSGETSDENVTYHYFIGGSGRDVNTNETVIGEIFEEQTGVNFQVEYLVGDLNERIGVMLAGGTYPDVVVGAGTEDMLVDAGAFIPLNDLLEEHGPNILEMYGEYLDRFTYPDGNIYYIPFGAEINEYQPMANIDQGAFWIQRGVLKEYDFPEVRTLDEYFDLITRYADENPEIDGMTTVPFTGIGHDTNFFRISNAPNHLAGYPNDGGVMIDMETHEASVYADSEHAKRYLEKLNELNAEGYLDQEMFVMNNDDYLAKLSSGRVLGFFDYGWAFGDARNALQEANDPDKEFMALPIVFDEDIKDQYIDPPAFVQNRGTGITVNAENPERIVQYWDNMVKEENQRLIMWGIEGEHYEVNDEGRYYRTEEQIELVRPQSFQEEFGMTTFSWDWPRINGTFSDGNSIEPRRQPEVATLEYREGDREYLDAYDIDTFSEIFSLPDDRPWYPAWSANIAPGSDADIFEENSDQLLKRHYPRIVLADPSNFEAEWDTFVEAYRSLNVDAYEEFFTRTVEERLNGNWQFGEE